MYKTQHTWFAAFTTQAEIKDEYRRLCRAHHPDLFTHNSTPDELQERTRVMQEINAAYAIAMDTAARRENPGKSEASYAGSADLAERIRQAIEAVIRFDNITIEICGAWVWVKGDTRPIKEALKEAGYRWAPRKDGQPWYFAGVASSNKGGSYTMDDIRQRYGSEYVTSQRRTVNAID